MVTAYKIKTQTNRKEYRHKKPQRSSSEQLIWKKIKLKNKKNIQTNVTIYQNHLALYAVVFLQTKADEDIRVAVYWGGNEEQNQQKMVSNQTVTFENKCFKTVLK